MVVVGKNNERETFQGWKDAGIKTEVSSKGGRISEQERAEITEDELKTKSPLGDQFSIDREGFQAASFIWYRSSEEWSHYDGVFPISLTIAL